MAAQRLCRALALSDTPEGAARVLELHPIMNPAGYVNLRRKGATIHVSASPAHQDGAWATFCSPDSPEVLQAVVRAVNPRLDVEISGLDTDWTVAVIRTEHAAPEADEVKVTKFSRGATFEFEARTVLPLTVV